MIAERIDPPLVTLTFADGESVELTVKQYAQLQVYFTTLSCRDCKDRALAKVYGPPSETLP